MGEDRFLVTCALVPDLYCPGHSSAETRSKDANLMKATARYKVNVSKIGARVQTEFSKKRKDGKSTKRQVATAC